MRIHADSRIKQILEKANKRIRAYCGPNYWFDYNLKDGKFWFIERRGPMINWIFPLDLNGYPLPNITEWEVYHAVKFLRRRRSPQAEEEFYKEKKYRQWYPDA